MSLRSFVRLARTTWLRKARSSTGSPPSLVTRSSGPGSTSLRGQPVALWCRPMATSIKPKVVNMTFVDRDGDEHVVEAKIGDSLLEVAKEHDIDLEGACEGTLSCSTCHLILTPEWFEKIPDPLTEEEQDMLDLAFGLTDTSRLGCQILVSKDLEGVRLQVPAGTRDARNT